MSYTSSACQWLMCPFFSVRTFFPILKYQYQTPYIYKLFSIIFLLLVVLFMASVYRWGQMWY